MTHPNDPNMELKSVRVEGNIFRMGVFDKATGVEIPQTHVQSDEPDPEERAAIFFGIANEHNPDGNRCF